MTIESPHFNGPITFLCDGYKCSEYLETNAQTFSGAYAKAKSRGWQARLINDSWHHLCPDCITNPTLPKPSHAKGTSYS